MGQAGTFTVTPPAADHNWLEWSLDGVTWTKVSTGGSTADKALSITPPKDGTHTLQVRSVDKADNKSEAIEYTFHAGPGGFVQPSDGERTTRRLSLVAEADASKYGSVSFSWRRSEADAWVKIPAGDVTSDGNALTAWPVALTNGKNAPLVWNATSTVDPDGSVQLKADFTGPNSTSGSTEPLAVVDRNADGAAVRLIGPGSVNLLTGNYTLSENDTSFYDMTVTRTRSSRSADAAADEDGQVAIFGSQWVSGTVAETSGSAYAYVRKTSDTAVDIVTIDGDAVHFTANAGQTGWVPEPGAEGLVLEGSVSGTFTLTDAEGAVTAFSKLDSSATTWQVSSTLLDGRDDSTTTLTSETVTVGGKQLARPKRIIAPTSAVSAATCAATPTTKGCRVWEFVYASSTTATADTFGDYTGRVKEILLYGTGRGATSSTARAVATYGYDADGRLRQQWNPRLAQSTQTQYAYDSAGHVTTYRSGTDQPWTLTYGKAGSADTAGEGMLLSASRPTLQQGTSATVDGNAVTNVVYDVPLSGTNAPHPMRATDVKAWGQTDVPTDATAVFPPDSEPSGHAGGTLGATEYARAAITYLGASGRQVDTAVPGGHISVTEYDRFGNVVRELSAANRALALGATDGDKAAQADLGIGALTTAERALLLSTTSVYSDDGARKLEEFGPLNRVDLTADLKSGTTTLATAGAPVTARAWTVNEFDTGRPTNGSATAKDQLTKTTVGVQVPRPDRNAAHPTQGAPHRHLDIPSTKAEHVKKSMVDIAAAALNQQLHTPGGEIPDTHPLDLAEGPVAADVWIDGDLGLVLLLHRRDDGFVASEVYYSLKGEDHRWTDAEHLSGEIVGFDLENPSAAANILSGASMVVLSESESRVFTGHHDDEDGDELIRLHELLVSEAVGSLRIEKSGPGTESESAVFHKNLTSRVAVVAVRPGERLRVVPLERSGSKTPATREGLDLFSSST